MLTVIGDVHGHHGKYLDIVENCPASVQVGDFGFDYKALNLVNHDFHKLIGGNHDNYDVIGDVHNYLGDFGVATVGGVTFFFVRGELSVDKAWRIPGRSWWAAEELSYKRGMEAIELYSSVKPDIVISHGCPFSVVPFFVTNSAKLIPSITSQLLDSMFEIHRPKRWIFGHHHNTKTVTVADCQFDCLNELDTLEIG